jgi:hypothetical protein
MRVLDRVAVLLALGAVWFAPRARAQSVVVGPVPAAMSAIPGASITVPVVADLTGSGGASLGSIAARLTWKPGTLTFVSTSLGALGSPAVNVDASSWILKFAVANAGGATGMPVLLNVTFTVTGAPADTTILGLSVDEITAAGTFANLKPITTVTPARFCTSTGTWGDVDGDGTFTAHDALIIVTNAVGLPIAPYSVVNGDVDGNGVVDTRDALIVLSEAVGIDVSQFRIGHLNAGICALRSAASVQIQPRTPSVAPGDSLPVTAVVRDSTGALVQGVGLVWASRDETIVRVGSTGSLVAVAPGSTRAMVFVQPGVKDSVPVVVTSVRHVWYVNPVVAAAHLGVELGSQLYPFSTIDTALVHAAANDTIRVAPSDYGPVVLKKPLVMLGEATAAGFPRLTNATGVALRVDTVAGAVTIHGFRLLNSLKGLVANLVQTLELGSVSVEGSRGPGIRVFGADSLLLAYTTVVGAVTEGIELDSVRTIVLDHVRSDAIARAPSDTVVPVALRIAQDSTLKADSVTLGTAGLRIDSTGAVALRRIRVTGSQGPAVRVNAHTISIAGGDFSGALVPGGGTPTSWQPSSYAVSISAGGSVRFDSSKVHDNNLFGIYLSGGTTDSLRGDTVAHNYPAPVDQAPSVFTGFGWLKVATSAFLSNGPGYVDIEASGTDSVTADTVVFDVNSVYLYDLAVIRMHGGAVRHGVAPALDIEDVGQAELDSVEASANTAGISNYDGFAMPAVFVYSGDSLTVNGINAHDNAGGALGAFYTGKLRVNGGTMLNNGFGPFPHYDTRGALVAYRVPDTRVYGLTLRDSADVGIAIAPSGISRTVVDSSFLEGSSTLIRDSYCCSSASGDTLIVSRSALTGFRGTTAYGVDADYLVRLVVTQNLIDSMGVNGVRTYGVDTTVASGNAIRAWGFAGINLNLGVLEASSNGFAGCVPSVAAIHAWQPDSTSIVGNSLTGCGSLIWVEGRSLSSGPRVQVFGNTLTRDTTTSLPGIFLIGGLGYVEVAGNSILGGWNGIRIAGTLSSSVDSARVDSNTVQQELGYAIRTVGVSNGLSLTYNLAADNAGIGLGIGSQFFTAAYNTVVRNGLGGVQDYTSGPSSFRFGNLAGNPPFGISTPAPSLLADGNWWGRPQGPKCLTGCDPTPTAEGDSIIGNVLYAPRDSIGPVPLAPAIPAPPAVGVFRPLALRSLAVPRTPNAPQGVRRADHAPPAALQSVPRPPAPRPSGRPSGHHTPVWKTGAQP